ncbi:uncharacterized protein LOC141760686 isoform X2 [Sebastes fasciatus]|uniref:uncharacterized protein LOC141760686 isoform X2 n=1 Tax=Sebastes fasciatus TaxID=394691 RepID=UPI003D9F7B36
MALMAALIILLFFLSGAASDQRVVTVNPGDKATLECVAADAFINVVEWTRDDLEPKYILLVIDGHPQPNDQHPSFKDRVELEDRKMENGDASLVLKNVRSNDNGTYRCRVLTAGSSRRKRAIDSDPIKTIQLEVTGNGDPKTDDPGNEDFPHVAVGLGAGLLLCSGMVIVMGSRSFLGRKRNLVKKSERSAVEAVDLQLI